MLAGSYFSIFFRSYCHIGTCIVNIFAMATLYKKCIYSGIIFHGVGMGGLQEILYGVPSLEQISEYEGNF